MMSSRMDKHSFDIQNNVGSRTKKNSDLYKELTTNRISTNIKEFDTDNNIVEITNYSTPQVNVRHRNSRQERVSFDSDNISNNFYDNIFGEEIENKNYDVNDILDTAKKNRIENDEDDKKRRLKSIEYNILTDLSKDKIQEYHDRKAKGITKEEEEDLEELINTITSNKLRKKIDEELFSDLMPSNPDETLISSNLLDDLKNERLSKMEKDKSNDLEDDDFNDDEIDDTENSNIDKSFYTHSMDLKKEDLIVNNDAYDDELDESFKEEKTSKLKIIIIVVLSLLVIAIIGYCIYNFI